MSILSTGKTMDPKLVEESGERIALNAAALRLFKSEYRDSGDRHSDAIFVREGILNQQEEITRLRLALAASRDEAEKVKADSARLDWLEGHVHHTHLDAAQESCYLIQHWDEKSARAAIDAARADAARKEQT